MTGLARTAIEQTADGLRIAIPSRKRILEIFFEGVVLLPFMAFEITRFLRGLGLGESEPADWLLIVLFALFGPLLYRRLNWLLFGEEVIVAGNSKLRICHRIRGTTRRSWEYDAARIRSLRVLPHTIRSMDTEPIWLRLMVGSSRSGRIAFNYRRDIVTFGAEVDEDEAHKIWNHLKPSFPT